MQSPPDFPLGHFHQIFFFNILKFLFQYHFTRFLRIVGTEHQYTFSSQQEGIEIGNTYACFAEAADGIVSPIPLLALGTVSELGLLGLNDNLAGGLGMIALVVLVAVAVVLFMQCGAAVREYEFLEKEPIETEHGVTTLVRERRAVFAPEYDRANRIGAALCILAAVPLFAAVMVGVSFLMSMSICLLLVLVACGVYAFVRVGTVQDAMDRLLEDGDFTRGHKAVKGRLTALTAAYWLVVVAIFLWYTFGPNGNGQPQYSWFIWAIAGVVYAACVVAAKAFVRKKV